VFLNSLCRGTPGTEPKPKPPPKPQKKCCYTISYVIGGWVLGGRVWGTMDAPTGGSVGFFGLWRPLPRAVGSVLRSPRSACACAEVVVPFLLSPACSSTRSMRAHRIRRLPAVPRTLCPPPLPPLLPSCGTTHSVPPPPPPARLPPPFYLLAVPRTREHASQNRLRVCEFRVHVR
jgi:hypothetical protein